MIVLVSEMVHLYVECWDFKLGLLPMCHLAVYNQYHLKCQDITDNAGDIKL